MCSTDCTDCSSSNKRTKVKKNRGGIFTNIFSLLAILFVLMAYFVGKINNEANYKNILREYVSQVRLEEISSAPLTYLVHDTTKGLPYLGYGTLMSGQGYGGKMKVVTFVNKEGKIKHIEILKQRETPSFYNKVLAKRFIENFIDKKAENNFIVGMDVDVVSGATITCKAISRAIADGAHHIGTEYLSMKPTWEEVIIKVGWKEGLLFIIILLSVFTIYKKNKNLRVFNLSLGLLFLGFYTNGSISISLLSSAMMGNFPSIQENLFWWILIGFAFLGPLILGKNFYCTSMCPFHALQILLNKISSFKITLPPTMIKLTRFSTRRLLFVSLILIFLTANSSLGSYEPFAMAFSLEGEGMHWYILPAALVGCFFISDFFCRYFCPVGEIFKFFIKLRRSAINSSKKLLKLN